MEKISRKQITLIYVGILIYMVVSSLVEDGLKRMPDIHWIVVGVVPIVAGFLALKLFARKEFNPVSYFKGKNKMTQGTFFRIFCGFCILLLIGAVLQNGIEMVLGFFGLSSTGRLDSIFESMFEENQTWSIISIVLAAPIAEELICRGYAAHALERGGKKFAIILSALLFAMMHANIIQGVNTFVMALMLGVCRSGILDFLEHGTALYK